ncbi:RNA-directed RNA polymerase L [Golovinomyces cichoracearum]|uniref:RNA-directed RNA polymerase L n=1 Tax=Golovinomyces cichoracearum TaxID=62708 RepID=A0A420HMS3_9PEZI|nr:RNA-directed RNA polymerase L [Golovinomyces cichoracearum]
MDDFYQVRRQFVNTFLDSAIIEGDMVRKLVEINKILSDEAQLTEFKATRLLLRSIPNYHDYEYQLYDPRDLRYILSVLPSSGACLDINRSHNLSSAIFKETCEQLDKICQIRSPPLILKDPSILYRQYLNKAELFVDYSNKVACSRAQGSRSIITSTIKNHNLIGDQYCCVLLEPSTNIARILPYEGVLMLKDLCLARANVFDGIRIIYPHIEELQPRILEILDWCEGCLVKYGNAGYEILKEIESITKAYLIEREDPIFTGDGALQRLTRALRKKELNLDPNIVDYSSDRLIEILQKCEKLQTLVQIYGLQKMTGHPLIDPRVGGASAAELASEKKTTSYHSAIKLRNNWCRLYLEGFIHKTNRWPELDFPTFCRSGNKLFQLYSLRETNISKSSYDLMDWTHVRFKKHVDFDYHENYLDLMDDKSISYYLSDFKATWDKSIKPKSHRRLLMEMLSRKNISIRHIIHLVESGQMPADWLIVSLYPKEREFKLAARMFGMMVFEMRAYFICLESNLADKIYPYIQQQTMTLTKNEIKKRFGNLNEPATKDRTFRLFLEIDLSRWKLRWRDLPIRLIGEDLNDIFGMGIAFSIVHEFFEKCLIVVRHNQYPPPGLDNHPPPTSDLLWYDHEGGFEGITQKTWSLANFAMIDLGIRQFGLDYHIIGQGDNQVILAHVKVPEHEITKVYIKKLTLDITKQIEMECKNVGQEAKPDGCFESTTVITYSKDVYIQGIEYYLSLNAISRIFPRGISDFPTISDKLESLASACVAASEKLDFPVLGYYIYLNHAARYLFNLRHSIPVESLTLRPWKRSEITPSMIRKILILPKILGGMSAVGPIDFIYKGGSDPLGKSLSNLSLFGNKDRTFLQRCIHTVISAKWTNRSQSLDEIFQDPYGLPLSIPQTAQMHVQKITSQYVRATTSNHDLKQLMEKEVDKYQEELKKTLLSVTPFNPPFLADVLKASVVGIRDSIAKMFTAIRTVQLLTLEDEMDPGSMILNSSTSGLLNLITRLKNIDKKKVTSMDSYKLSNNLRQLWEQLNGSNNVKVTGVTNYMPLDFKISLGYPETPCESIRVFYDGDRTSKLNQGSFPPFLGVNTQEKRSRHGYKIVTENSSDKAVSKLYKIMTQPGLEESFEQMISNVALTRTNLDIRQLKHFSSKSIGGCIGHRYKSVFDMERASVLSGATFATHIKMQTNHAGLLSASLEDYPVNFSEFFACGIGLLNYRFERGEKDSTVLEFKVPEYLEPLPNENMRVNNNYITTTPQLTNNKLVFTPGLSLIRQERPFESALFQTTDDTRQIRYKF